MTTRIMMSVAPPLTYERVREVAEENGWEPEPEEAFDPDNYAPSEFGLKNVWATVERDGFGGWYAVFPVYPCHDPDTGELIEPGAMTWHVPSERAGVAMVRAYREEHYLGDPERLQELIRVEQALLAERRNDRRTMLRECGVWDE